MSWLSETKQLTLCKINYQNLFYGVICYRQCSYYLLKSSKVIILLCIQILISNKESPENNSTLRGHLKSVLHNRSVLLYFYLTTTSTSSIVLAQYSLIKILMIAWRKGKEQTIWDTDNDVWTRQALVRNPVVLACHWPPDSIPYSTWPFRSNHTNSSSPIQLSIWSERDILTQIQEYSGWEIVPKALLKSGWWGRVHPQQSCSWHNTGRRGW